MECSKCKQMKTATKDVKFPCFPCDLCRNLYCLECSELTPTEIKCMPLQKRILKFHCNKCRNYDLVDLLRGIIKDKEVIIEEKEEKNKLLKDKLSSYEEKRDMIGVSTYANITATTKRDSNKNFASVIVKPKVVQNALQTKGDIAKKVNPADLKIGIRNVRTTRDGSVIIKCSTKDENEILENAIKDKLTDYSVNMTKMRKPKIKIANFREEMTAKDIERNIAEQNDVSEVKVTYVKKQKTGFQTILCECSQNAFKKLITMRRVCIGWQRYPVYEDLDIPRCFKCQEFYHKKNNCMNKVACAICGEEHDRSECSKRVENCINCINSNNKYKIKHNTNHESTDMNCPTLKYHMEMLKNKTDYSTQW